ncbi:alpha/beta hydrolase [Sphingosinicella sp. CPCC 101087]|uniref:alpha/beta hydrolase n=1 Tax=Sphingosinicella sp. CPCC 101087 TaxID=2497754 RepID=UPI00101D4760|nr:alpha/beta hydrolase [Sphingosinicella sp. CPCC 101087]
MDRRTLFDRLAVWGNAFTMDMIQGTHALFAPLVDRQDESRVVRDLAYGDHERHRLDLFRPTGDAAGAPVLVFVHGGGFVRGDKGASDAPFHNNIGAWAARRGYVGVTLNYRLAPASQWPSGAEDVGRAVAWLAANVEAHGGDPRRIFIMGQSAGATHVADVVARPELLGEASLAGAIMISGVYDVGRADRNDFQRAYYGEDESGWPRCSTLDALADSALPCFHAVAEYDPPDFQRQAAWLVETHVSRHARWPEIHWLKGHNHLSTVAQIGSAHDTLGPLVGAYIEGRSRV